MRTSDSEAILRWIQKNASELTLVGGQALAVWEQILGLRLTVQTQDIDVLGMAENADTLAFLVGGTLDISDPMSSSPNLAAISKDGEPLVDFLCQVYGLSENDILRRRIPAETDEGQLYLMHPLDCMVSKLSNYFRLPDKKTTAGLQQLESTIQISRRYGERLLSSDNEKAAIRLTNEIYALAGTQDGKKSWMLLDIDLTDAVPTEKLFMAAEYHEENLPRLRAKLSIQRERFRAFLEQRNILASSRMAAIPKDR